MTGKSGLGLFQIGTRLCTVCCHLLSLQHVTSLLTKNGECSGSGFRVTFLVVSWGRYEKLPRVILACHLWVICVMFLFINQNDTNAAIWGYVDDLLSNSQCTQSITGSNIWIEPTWSPLTISCSWIWKRHALKNLGRLWLAYTELQGDFCMLQVISVDSRHLTLSFLCTIAYT